MDEIKIKQISFFKFSQNLKSILRKSFKEFVNRLGGFVVVQEVFVVVQEVFESRRSLSSLSLILTLICVCKPKKSPRIGVSIKSANGTDVVATSIQTPAFASWNDIIEDLTRLSVGIRFSACYTWYSDIIATPTANKCIG
jgi:hypothetical protein